MMNTKAALITYQSVVFIPEINYTSTFVLNSVIGSLIQNTG